MSAVVNKGSNKTGMVPLVGENPKILILGTLPGDESLAKQEYYANRSNRFWKVIFGIFGKNDIPADYKSRKEFLVDNGIALWDTIKEAERKGSTDLNISKEMFNDVTGFLKKYPTIKVVAFNGKKAKEYFAEYSAGTEFPEDVTTMSLLSTSSANCRYSLSNLVKNWSQLIVRE